MVTEAVSHQEIRQKKGKQDQETASNNFELTLKPQLPNDALRISEIVFPIMGNKNPMYSAQMNNLLWSQGSEAKYF